MINKLIAWGLIGVLGGLWILLYKFAGEHGAQPIMLLFSILAAAGSCNCNKADQEG